MLDRKFGSLAEAQEWAVKQDGRLHIWEERGAVHVSKNAPKSHIKGYYVMADHRIFYVDASRA